MVNFRNIAAISAAVSFVPLIEASKVSSAVKVHLPSSLQRANGYDHREALFGIPPYGGSILQNVQYTTENLCSPFQPPSHWRSSFILMVDRGDCTFVQKVRNAQHAGAVAVVIADNVCQCKHDKTCTPEKNSVCEKHEPVMADDGSGYDITIPSVLLFKQDADPIKNVLMKNKNVMLELSWSLPNPDDHVEWELWTSPTDQRSLDFKNDFRDAALALASRVTFTPYEYLYDGIESKCMGDDGVNYCTDMCTNNGRYCSTGPNGAFDTSITGVDVVKESARRLCIWELFGYDGTGLEWWDYIRGFTNKCDNIMKFTDDDCVKEVMNDVGIDYDRIEECVFNHGPLDQDGENDMLEGQLLAKKLSGVVIMPVAYVNGVPVRGALEFATVFKAICAGFKSGTEPSICQECANCSDEKACVLKKKCMDKAGTVSTNAFIGSLMSVSLIFGIFGTFLYIRQQRQMREEVRGILKEYMPVQKNGMDANEFEFDTQLEQDDEDVEGTFT
jgi:hypothetical protein